MTLLVCLLTAVAVWGYLRRDAVMSWFADRAGVAPPPEIVDLDDDTEAAWDAIVAGWDREAR